MPKTVLITGCSSGFGKLSAKKFQKEGWNVIATMRSPEKEQELNQLENVLVSRLDVSQLDSIESSIAEGIAKFGSIDVLVNNAGYGGHAMLEQFSEQQIYDMFETNVFGLMRVSRAVLPLMRRQGAGVIINVTSMAGYIGLAMTSTYCASKFAVEGLTEALALEYKPFNIKVKSVAPGAFGTNFSSATVNNLTKGDEEVQAHAQKVMARFAQLAEQMRMQGGQEADPQEAADKIFMCATEETPIHNVVGADAEMLIGMKNSMSQEDFIAQMEAMLQPQNS